MFLGTRDQIRRVHATRFSFVLLSIKFVEHAFCGVHVHFQCPSKSAIGYSFLVRDELASQVGSEVVGHDCCSAKSIQINRQVLYLPCTSITVRHFAAET